MGKRRQVLTRRSGKLETALCTLLKHRHKPGTDSGSIFRLGRTNVGNPVGGWRDWDGQAAPDSSEARKERWLKQAISERDRPLYISPRRMRSSLARVAGSMRDSIGVRSNGRSCVESSSPTKICEERLSTS